MSEPTTPRSSPKSWERMYGAMAVLILPILQNNYCYILIQGGLAAVIDPGEAEPVLRVLSQRGLRLTDILVTHGHHDHIGGVAELRSQTGARLTAPAGVALPGVDRAAGEGDRLVVGALALEVWSLPGHLSPHVAYWSDRPEPGLAFVGDVLMGAGCGRIFDPPAGNLYRSLQRLLTLPVDLHLYCGHDLAVENLAFALTIEPSDADLRERLAREKARAMAGEPGMPITLADERKTNLFLRAENVGAFSAMRRAKDDFRMV